MTDKERGWNNLCWVPVSGYIALLNLGGIEPSKGWGYTWLGVIVLQVFLGAMYLGKANSR